MIALLATLFGSTRIAGVAAGIASPSHFLVMLLVALIAGHVHRAARQGQERSCLTTFRFAASLLLLGALAATGAGCEASGTHPGAYGVWLKVYDDKDLDMSDDWAYIEGPAAFADMDDIPNTSKPDWDDGIESLHVGPDARVQVFDEEGFRGRMRDFGPNVVVTDLEDYKFESRIESIKIILAR